MDRLKLSGSMATTLLSSYDSVFLAFCAFSRLSSGSGHGPEGCDENGPAAASLVHSSVRPFRGLNETLWAEPPGRRKSRFRRRRGSIRHRCRSRAVVIDGPDIPGLVDHRVGLQHDRSEAWGTASSVQRFPSQSCRAKPIRLDQW
jgi:hypothetical protein